MKGSFAFRASVSLIAMVAASPVFAQQAPTDGQNGGTITSTSQVSQMAPSTALAGGDIVVTGYRRSLGSAQDQKRTSTGILDSIVSDDIGKLPDNNAAEALARVTGVQVSRYNDEAGDIFVRGLTDITTTFNGRELFSADDRKLHLQDFPAGVAAGIEVYKSGTADLIEPGLAGLINLRSRRPFDIKDVNIAGEIRATYNDQSKSFDPAGNILATKRWDTPIGEIGALINFSYVRSTYRDADRYDDSNPITPAGYSTTNPADDLSVLTPGIGNDFTFPNAVGNYYSKGTRYRPAVNGTVQWRPAPNLELYAEGLWQAYRGVETIDAFGVDLDRVGADGSAGSLSNVVVKDGKAISLTKSGGYSPTFNRAAQNDRTDTYQGAVGFKWQTGRATITGDFAYTNSRYYASSYRVDGQFFTVPTVNVNFDTGGSSIINLNDYDSKNAANYQWSGYDQNFSESKGNGVQGRLDLNLDTDIDWLPKLQFGFRATDHRATVTSGDRYAAVTGLGIPLDSLPTGALEMVTDGFGSDAQQFRSWLEPSRAAIRSNGAATQAAALAALEQLAAANPTDRGLQQSITAFSSTGVPVNPSAGYRADEATYAAYAQGKYAFDLFGLSIDGTAGVRIVNTAGTYSGSSQIVDQSGNISYAPRSSSNNYVDVLPSIQSRIHLTSDLQMRLAFTETRTRPGFGQLNPALNITRATPAAGGAAIFDAYGSSGNPSLKPLSSKNYDATLEYYFSKNGSASIAGFYHDLNGFIGNYTTNYQDPVYGLVQLNRPENAGKGHIKGVEASVQTFFDFLPGWLSGFGAQANLTYLQGSNALPASLGQGGQWVPITGVSKWTYNLTGFYERGPISARISYNYRSHFVDGYSANLQNQQLAEVTRSISRLDLSLSYEAMKGVSVVANVSNLLQQPFNNYRYFNATQYFPRDLRLEGRYFSLGVRFKM